LAQPLPCTIVVADDYPDVAAGMAEVLSLRGHRVVQAFDGADAWEKCRTLHPDIALLDIGMPGLTGLEVCERIRAEPWGEHTTVVACTGWAQPADVQRALATGFDFHFTKPVKFDRLFRIIDAHAQRAPDESGRAAVLRAVRG
jgi:CheY-like chemotaxis protein